jgi:hypothetical protein
MSDVRLQKKHQKFNFSPSTTNNQQQLHLQPATTAERFQMSDKLTRIALVNPDRYVTFQLNIPFFFFNPSFISSFNILFSLTITHSLTAQISMPFHSTNTDYSSHIHSSSADVNQKSGFNLSMTLLGYNQTDLYYFE